MSLMSSSVMFTWGRARKKSCCRRCRFLRHGISRGCTHNVIQAVAEPPSLRGFKNVELWHLGTWVSAGLGMAGHDALRDLSQLELFCDSLFTLCKIKSTSCSSAAKAPWHSWAGFCSCVFIIIQNNHRAWGGLQAAPSLEGG